MSRLGLVFIIKKKCLLRLSLFVKQGAWLMIIWTSFGICFEESASGRINWFKNCFLFESKNKDSGKKMSLPLLTLITNKNRPGPCPELAQSFPVLPG